MTDAEYDRRKSEAGRGITRRQALGLGGLLACGASLAGVVMWWKRYERGKRAGVFIGSAASYEADLVALIGAGLRELGVSRQQVRGKRVLLKPNLVETTLGSGHINTNPAMVVAAAEVFRRLDAAEVFVAEGQGHRRDSWLVLDESGMGRALKKRAWRFVDLNHDDVEAMTNLGLDETEATLSAEDVAVGGHGCLDAEAKDASLGGRDVCDEESVRRDAGDCVRLAEERVAFFGDSQLDSGY